MKIGFNYDKIINNVHLKYAIPVLAAKRAEVIKNEEELKDELSFSNKNYVNEAFIEIENKVTVIKDENKLNYIKTDVKK